MSEYARTNDGDLVFKDFSGWGEKSLTDERRFETETSIVSKAQDDMPRAWSKKPRTTIPPALKARLDEAHQKRSMGMDEGSIDLRLISEIAFGEVFKFPAQRIGSCVSSGGNRAWTFASMWQLLVNGDPEELLGNKRLSVDTVSHYGPMSYGLGRRRGNMRRGDGSYCGVQVESYQKDGVLDCNTPQLHRITGTDTSDFPEPRSSSLYRAFGSWRYLDDLLPYCDYKLNESIKVRDADQSEKLLREYYPHMICSGWGFAPTRDKVNGYTIYRRSGSWSHNMTIIGVLVGSNGNKYIIVLNSWGPSAHRDGEIFVIPIELYAKWLRNASCIAIGDIELPKSTPSIF